MKNNKQAAYLSALLDKPQLNAASTKTEESVQPTSSSTQSKDTRGGMTLLARESALAKVATGEVKQVTQLLLDPRRVRIWEGNPRLQIALTEESCRELIDSILSEGSQKVPAIVRRVSGDPQHEYEVVAGSRRHWAISWLRANNYPDMMFLAQVHNLDDEAAFRISDIENRARKDVSDFERAVAYLHALDVHYGGKQVRMAERLKLSKGWLSKMLTVAALPDWIVAAFPNAADIQLGNCYPLAKTIQALSQRDDQVALKRLAAIAAEIVLEKEKGHGNISAAEVIRRLVAKDVTDERADQRLSFSMPSGRVALSVLSTNRNGVSIRLHAGSGASESDLAKMLKSALHDLEKLGRPLR